MKNYPMETDEELLSDMIILGLSWKAKDEDIRDYFSRFGELDYYEVCSVMVPNIFTSLPRSQC